MVINYMLYGAMIVQFVLLIFYFFIFKKVEFLYLMLTGLFVLIFLTLILYPDLISVLQRIGLPFTYEVRNAFIFLAMATYYLFVFNLLGDPDKNVFFGKIVKWASTVLIIAGGLYMVRNLLGTNGHWLLYILVPVYFLNYFMQAYSVFYLFRTKLSRVRLIAYATLFLFVISKFSVLPNFQANDLGAQLVDSSYFVFIGVNVNFFFFTISMIYGMWHDLKSMAKLELEKAVELHQQRVDISNDLHDDLGATLSSLHIYSAIATKFVDENPGKARANLGLISAGVFTLMEKINDVIWSVSSKQSNVSLLSTRIKDFFVEIFDSTGIKCHYAIDVELESNITGLKSRKLLLLIAKEAINNAIKHSKAKNITFSIQHQSEYLQMSIEDDGIGIGNPDFSKGNGLSNLKYRTEQLGGYLYFENIKPRGTSVECHIPLTSISA